MHLFIFTYSYLFISNYGNRLSSTEVATLRTGELRLAPPGSGGSGPKHRRRVPSESMGLSSLSWGIPNSWMDYNGKLWKILTLVFTLW